MDTYAYLGTSDGVDIIAVMRRTEIAPDMKHLYACAIAVHARKIDKVDSKRVCLIIDILIDEKTRKSIADPFEISFEKDSHVFITQDDIHETLPRCIKCDRNRLLCITLDGGKFSITGGNMTDMLDTLANYTRRDAMTLRDVVYMGIK